MYHIDKIRLMVLLKVFLAQLEERQPSKLNVSGSNPLEYDGV